MSRSSSLARLPHKAQNRARLPLESPQKPSSATIQAWLATALRHYDAGHMAEAERLCLQILARDVRHADALYVLGIVAYRTNRLPAAASMIRRAIAVNPRQPFYQANLGNVLSAQGKYDEAIPYYQRALHIDPNLAEASYNLGNAFREQKKFDQAAACYQRAISVKPDYVDAMCNLGVVYGMQNKLDQAVAINQRAIALAPDRADLLCNLGDIFHN